MRKNCTYTLIAYTPVISQLPSALTQYPDAVSAIMEAASRMRRPIDAISVED
jgi:hypothetical protein